MGIQISLAPAGTAAVTANEIYTNYYGIYVWGSDLVLVNGGNDVYDNYIGIYLTGSDASIGSANRIHDNDFGIHAQSSSPYIFGDEIYNSSQVGLRLVDGSHATVESTTIDNSGIWSVYSEGPTGSNPQFLNCSIAAGVGAGELYQKDDSHPWMLNTTFDKSMVTFGDALSNITVSWFLHVKVIDTSYVEVPGATVWINDTYGTNLFNLVTDAQGMANWNIITEYIENISGYEYYFSPHNVSAVEGGRFGFTEPTMTGSRFVIVMLEGISIDIILEKGWNMISIPVDQPSSLITDVFSAISGRYDAVQWYDVIDTADHWKHYHISKPALLNDLSDVFKTMGVWIFMDSNDILSIAGPIPVPGTTNIDLKTGWNLVGYPSVSPMVAGNASGEAFESITGLVDMVQYYDASDSSDPWKEWDPGSLSPDDLTTIEMGMGLWIHVTGDCTWTVNF